MKSVIVCDIPYELFIENDFNNMLIKKIVFVDKDGNEIFDLIAREPCYRVRPMVHKKPDDENYNKCIDDLLKFEEIDKLGDKE